MLASTMRRGVARVMPHGFSERTALEVERTFASDRAASPRHSLTRILEHAVAEVPFYRRRHPSRFEQLPVVDKTMMVGCLEDFLSAGYDPARLASRMSSGSSGIPFTSSFDAARIARHRSELVGGYRYLGADPFGSFVHCRPWLHASRAERLSAPLRGQFLYSGEQDEAAVRTTARWIGRRRGTTIIGLCSVVETLFRRFEDLSLSVPAGAVGVVLGVGEPASRYLLDAVPRLCGVELSRRYSNTENGILGFARGAASAYQLDTSSYHVEILAQDGDAPAPPGEVGRIVVSDLHNRAMPFLRYDTGDLGRFAVDAAGTPVPNALAELVGRRSDVPLAGTAAAPRRGSYYRLFMRVDANPEIRQFQLRQHAIGDFTWVLTAELSAPLEARIRQLMDEEIGDILRCEFRYVTDLPLSQSGKRRFFVNEIADPEALLARP